MSALDDEILFLELMEDDHAPDLKSELAALRAQVALLDDYAATIRAHEITIAEQARALAEARKQKDEWRLWYIKLYHKSNNHPVDHVGMCTACLQLLDRLDGTFSVHPAPEAAEPQP